MPYTLKGRNVLVTGGSRGLGALVAEKFASEGCNIAINYLSSKDRAQQTADKIRQSYGSQASIIQGDTGVHGDCVRIVQEAIQLLGGLDIIVSNAGYTRFSEFGDLSALSEEDWDKCWAVNVKAQMFLFREALPTFNSNANGGVFLITSSIAGVAIAGSSMAYSTTKAAGLHLMKCLAQTQGAKVRVNAILPGLLMTEWGEKFPAETISKYKERAVLKDVTDLNDCADAFVMVAKNSSMTGQKIQVDAGIVVAAM